MRADRGLLGLVLVALLGACEPQDGEWSPVLEADVPRFLATELERVRDDVVEARRAVTSDAEDAGGPAAERLRDAEDRLSTLTGVYLPLYGAKVAAANAYRRHQLGEEREASRDLDRIDEAVAVASRTSAGALEAELEQVSERVARARVALEGGSTEAGERLRELAELLDDLITRAGLVL